jgi:enamine deaminase RidA (YjgF/YER057c/UK114 family)
VERRVINPWQWQDQFGFVQANEVRGMQRVLLCAGQISVDVDGRPINVGDIRAQMIQALDNLETVLHAADFRFADVVRLNVYTTDIDRLFEAYDALAGRLTDAGCRTAITLLGVTRLAFPELLVELEATTAD